MTGTNQTNSEQASPPQHHLPLHLLPPDVQLQLLEYLELNELKLFSETSYHCNSTVACFLKRQLDLACRTTAASSPQDIYKLKGTEFIHRLARLDATAAAHLLLLPLDERNQADSSNRSNNRRTRTTTTINSAFLRQQRNATALRQLLSDGLAAMHEQQRRTAQQLWSHAGAGTVLVLAMAGRLFYQTVRERLFLQEHHPATAPAQWYEWHDLSRLAVGLLFAGTVFVGVSKQQKRRKAVRLAAKLEAEAAQAVSSILQKSLQKSVKRSLTVAGDLAALAADAAASSSLPHSPRSVSLSKSTVHLSVSMPNLHHMLLHHPDYVDKSTDERIHSQSSSSSHDANEQEEEHSALQESLWNMTEDEYPAKQKDPLQQQQQQQHQDVPFSRLGENQACTLDSLPNSKRKTSEIIKSEAAASHSRPHGCVGAFQRAVADAKIQIVCILKNQRKQSFEALSSDNERADLSTALIDSCTDDASLDAVRIMARRLPLDEFYVGSDNTESCALHTAAFHGACNVLDFLCRGVDCSSWNSKKIEDDDGNKGSNYENDGGLCNVNARDANGWTALHFAAGANCPEAVAVLVRHGAIMDTEAHNGYTPLQWALRLQNRQVADELRRWLAEEKKQSKKFWFVLGQRLVRLVGRWPSAANTDGRA